MPDAPAPAPKPVIRPGARVILLDRDDRLLLIRTETEKTDPPVLWITPGGAVEDGETFEQTARRELWEETGIEHFELGPCVWLRQSVWRWGEIYYDSRERYYLARVDGVEVTAERMLVDEILTFTGFRWWTLDELAASDEFFVPRSLASLLAPLLAGEVPAEPIEVGE